MLRIIRTRHESHFTVLPNALLRDRRLGGLAHHVLTDLLSRPDGWQTNADQMWQEARQARGNRAEGRRAFRQAFAELEEFGYLVRRRVREGSKWITVMEVYDVPRVGGTDSGTSEIGTSETGTSLRSTDDGSTDEEGTPSVRGCSTTGAASAGDAAERTEKNTEREAGAREGAPSAAPATGSGVGQGAPAPTEPPGWAVGMLRLIPDAALARPAADRRALAGRLAALAEAGVDRAELAAAVAGADTAERPYAALRARLASPESVRAWNSRSLGEGMLESGLRGARGGDGTTHPTGPGAGGFEWEPWGPEPRFDVGSDGKAARTCPAHPGIRNVPGGSCAACGGPCRTFPGQDVAPPPAPASAPAESGVPGGGQVLEAPGLTEELAAEDGAGEGDPEGLEVDPAEVERMLASLDSARCQDAPAPAPQKGRAPTAAARAAADGVRGILAALKEK